ncbi:unnamed protein product, partial [Chrysoparadoxa australica]
RRIGSPKHLLAPMVDASELAFRMLCRRYGAHLCYTPMTSSKRFCVDPNFRIRNTQSAPPGTDEPLIYQFAGDDPVRLLAAATYVQDHCGADAVDINLGCPQNIAKRGHYGAFLLEEVELIERLVATLDAGLRIPVTVKVRLLNTLDDSIMLCKRLVAAGAQMVVVHGRVKEALKDLVGEADWHAIRAIREALPVPVFANGNIACLDDVKRCMAETGCAGVMSSEGILENPGLFSDNVSMVTGRKSDLIDLCEEYLEIAEEHQPPSVGTSRSHAMKMLFTGLAHYTDLRHRLS